MKEFDLSHLGCVKNIIFQDGPKAAVKQACMNESCLFLSNFVFLFEFIDSKQFVRRYLSVRHCVTNHVSIHLESRGPCGALLKGFIN